MDELSAAEVPDDTGRVPFESFVAASGDRLLRTVYLLTRDHGLAEDLLQTALTRSWPRWRRIDGDPEPYVRTILVRQNVSRWRVRRWRELTTDQLPERPAGGPDPDDRVLLHRALGTLAPRQRAVIVLRYFEDLTEAQTAEALGIAVGTVKSQARDALRRLREVLPDLADVLVSP